MQQPPPAAGGADDRLELYDYELPKELVAQHPAENRTAARMMVLHREGGRIEHCSVRDLPEFIRGGDAVVVNDSKVLPARLVGYRTTTRGRWEGLYLQSDPQTGLAELLSKTRGNIELGESVTLRDREGREQQRLELVARGEGGVSLYRPEPAGDWMELLGKCGRVPLPPYIRGGQMENDDLQRYQTVYARQPGSVAAPTAGLHFTPDLIAAVRAGGAAFVSVTLHVGVGTFRPIESPTLSGHRMHSEICELSEPVAKRLQQTRGEGGRIIAVGTTTVRTLESAAANNGGAIAPWAGSTELFITPGHRFAAVDAMLTNFHLPKSSLLVLVSSFAGRELILDAYRQAVEQKYRFFSYGDCMLIV